VTYNFQTGKNKIKLLREYESVTQKVLSCIDSMLQNAKQLQYSRLSWHVSCPSDIQFPSKCSPAFACGVTVSIAAATLPFPEIALTNIG
jgi:hypothetical protein